MAYEQGYPRPDRMVYALRTSGRSLSYVGAVRETVHRADPRVPMSEVRTPEEDIDRAINWEMTFARLCTAFAVLALAIACVGLYGAVSYNVARRTSEMGIRIGLGAQRGGVVKMVLREVAVLRATGLSAGLAVALATAQFIGWLPYGLKPRDPTTLALAVVILSSAAFVAGYVPARRASRIDPMTALRID
jgi:macrolide transport system ATP-binding/permease protein